MNRTLVWIEQPRFRGFGCSECGCVFKAPGAPAGKSFDEMMQKVELQRDKEFTLRVLRRSPKRQEHKRARTLNNSNCRIWVVCEAEVRVSVSHKIETFSPEQPRAGVVKLA